METAMIVEKGHPIPRPTTRVYPFGDMEPGDSFFVPPGENAERTKNNVRCAAKAFGRRKGWKFTVRKDGEGVRVWRLS